MVSQVSRLRFEVSRQGMEKEITNPQAELSTFRALPSFGSGLFAGLRLSSFSKNCKLPRFGLKEEDVIEMVNGEPVRTPWDIMEIGKKLAKAHKGSKVRVNIRRGDEDVVQTYLVVD
jgi:hypothetical protein